MCRVCWVGLCLLTLVACRLPPDRPPLKPLPEDGQVYSYAEILGRARVQATLALEAFYVDGWADLEEVAHAIAPQAQLDETLVLRAARRVSEQLNEAQSRGR